MRIAHTIPHHLGKMGGLQIYLHNIAKEQVKNWHEVFMLTHPYLGKLSDYPYKIIKIKQLGGISDNSKIILSVGRFHSKKNYSIIPEVMKYLIENNCGVHWMVISSHSGTTFDQAVNSQVMDRIILKDELKSWNGYDLSVKVPLDELTGAL